MKKPNEKYYGFVTSQHLLMQAFSRVYRNVKLNMVPHRVTVCHGYVPKSNMVVYWFRLHRDTDKELMNMFLSVHTDDGLSKMPSFEVVLSTKDQFGRPSPSSVEWYMINDADVFDMMFVKSE